MVISSAIDYQPGTVHYVVSQVENFVTPASGFGPASSLLGQTVNRYIPYRFIKRVSYREYIDDCKSRGVDTNGWTDIPGLSYWVVEHLT